MSFTYSIIIPVYNTRKYLGKCIDSLIRQTYSQIEILIIDDGSTDSSKDIYTLFEDKRIKIFYKENTGLSDTRNYGLKRATGDYIVFLDSDDYLDLDGIENLNHLIEDSGDKPNVITVSLKQVSEIGEKVNILSHTTSNSQIISGYEFFKNEIENNTMYMAATSNVYSKSFLLGNRLFFKKGILHEDEHFTPRVLLLAKTVLPSSLCFYNYVIHDNSITTKKATVKNFVDLYNTLVELEEIYQKFQDIQLKRLCMNNILEKYLYMYARAGMHEKKFKKIKHKEFVYKKAYYKKNKVKVFLFLLNDSLYCYLYKRVYFKN